MESNCTCGPVKHMVGAGNHDARCPEFIADQARYSTPLTLGEFRRQTAHLADDTVFCERAHSEVRLVMVGDFEAEGELGIDEELMEEMGGSLKDVGFPEGSPIPKHLITFKAYD